MLALLCPKPFRGDQVAAGTVVLCVLVLLLNVRFADAWATGAHLAYTGLVAVLVLGMSVAAPREPAGPPAWHSTLYVAGYLLAAATLANLADVLGSDGGAGTYAWVGLTLTSLAAWMSRARGSAAGTLLAAVTAVLTSLAVLQWTSSPEGVTSFRYLLLADTVVLVLAALWLRVRGPAHGVQLLNAVGLSLLAIATTFAFSIFGLGVAYVFGVPDTPPVVHVAWGWTLLILAGGIGILSAGAADGERGNVLIGIVLLLVFVVMASEGNLLGWPILLGAAAIALLVIGLRPSTPLPSEPPPGAGGGAPPSPLPVPPLR
jgi:hypothetical protein